MSTVIEYCVTLLQLYFPYKVMSLLLLSSLGNLILIHSVFADLTVNKEEDSSIPLFLPSILSFSPSSISTKRYPNQVSYANHSSRATLAQRGPCSPPFNWRDKNRSTTHLTTSSLTR